MNFLYSNRQCHMILHFIYIIAMFYFFYYIFDQINIALESILSKTLNLNNIQILIIQFYYWKCMCPVKFFWMKYLKNLQIFSFFENPYLFTFQIMI